MIPPQPHGTQDPRLVELTKLAATPGAQAQPGSWDTYLQGEENAASLPVDYTLVGFLLAPPAIGRCVEVLRLERNNVISLGMFATTEVQHLTPDGFATRNSVYRLRALPRPQVKPDPPQPSDR